MNVELDFLLGYLQKREESLNEALSKLKNGKIITAGTEEAERLTDYLYGKKDMIDEIKWLMIQKEDPIRLFIREEENE